MQVPNKRPRTSSHESKDNILIFTLQQLDLIELLDKNAIEDMRRVCKQTQRSLDPVLGKRIHEFNELFHSRRRIQPYPGPIPAPTLSQMPTRSPTSAHGRKDRIYRDRPRIPHAWLAIAFPQDPIGYLDAGDWRNGLSPAPRLGGQLVFRCHFGQSINQVLINVLIEVEGYGVRPITHERVVVIPVLRPSPTGELGLLPCAGASGPPWSNFVSDATINALQSRLPRRNNMHEDNMHVALFSMPTGPNAFRVGIENKPPPYEQTFYAPVLDQDNRPIRYEEMPGAWTIRTNNSVDLYCINRALEIENRKEMIVVHRERVYQPGSPTQRTRTEKIQNPDRTRLVYC